MSAKLHLIKIDSSRARSLANAGVSSDDIIADYAESVHAMAGAALHGGPIYDRQASWTPAQVTVWLDEVTPHVHAFVADAEAMMDVLGIGAETRRALRELLTP